MNATLRGLLAAPDQALLEAGAGGERLVADTRLVFFGILCLVPVVVLTAWPDSQREVWIGLLAGIVGLLFAGGIAQAVRSGRPIRGLAFITSAFDVTLVSATLAGFALAGSPEVAVGSLVVWEIYLLAIFATTLRFDLRVCFAAGLLSLVQYAAILAWVPARWNVVTPDPAARYYGPINWPAQAARLILMLAATALASGVVLRVRRLIHISGSDRLTGLANRAYFDERLAAEVARARRTGQPLSLAFLDLDRFKLLNDRLGHAAGDAALQRAARVLKEACRAEDVVARWGGEEFVLLLPDTDLAGAHAQAERVRKGLAATPLLTPSGPTSLTLSAGCAVFPAEATDAASLISRADGRLLAAKRGGRNCVVSADAPADRASV